MSTVTVKVKPVRAASTSAASSKSSGRKPAISSRGAFCRSRLRRTRSWSGSAPSEVDSTPFSRVPRRKFMAGEPMKPATNRLRGSS